MIDAVFVDVFLLIVHTAAGASACLGPAPFANVRRSNVISGFRDAWMLALPEEPVIVITLHGVGTVLATVTASMEIFGSTGFSVGRLKKNGPARHILVDRS